MDYQFVELNFIHILVVCRCYLITFVTSWVDFQYKYILIVQLTDFVPTKSMLAKIILLNFSFSAVENYTFSAAENTFSPELNNRSPKEKKLLHIYKKPPKVLETKHFRRL